MLFDTHNTKQIHLKRQWHGQYNKQTYNTAHTQRADPRLEDVEPDLSLRAAKVLIFFCTRVFVL